MPPSSRQGLVENRSARTTPEVESKNETALARRVRDDRDAFGRATTFVPLRATSWLGLALAESGVRNPEGALAAAERAATLDPTLGLARAVRADALVKLGRPCEALEAARGVALEAEQEREILRRVEDRAREGCTSPLPN